MTEPLRTTVHGALLVIELDRPAARNAVTRRMSDLMDDALTRLDEDEELRVGIVTGTGRSFCAGMDLKELATLGVAATPRRGFGGIVARPSRKPLIAAVEGHAIGGGFEIALACDLIVAGRGASFALPEIRVGLVAAGGGLVRLPRRLPYHRAMELALTGRPESAQVLHDWGLVNRVVDDGSALTTARALGLEIADTAPLAAVATKAIIVQTYGLQDRAAFEQQRPLSDPVLDSEDAAEGVLAHLERRPPAWTRR